MVKMKTKEEMMVFMLLPNIKMADNDNRLWNKKFGKTAKKKYFHGTWNTFHRSFIYNSVSSKD